MRSFLTALLGLCLMHANAQNLHLTLFGGYANYQGDLQDKRYTTKQAHAAFGGGLLYEISNHFSARANVTYGTISAGDSLSPNKIRNLSFSSPITEYHLGFEYNILDIYQNSFTPYIFAGLGYFHFNPSAIDSSGNKVFLQPLGTEGQGFYNNRKKYKLSQMSIPFGGGVKFALGDNVRVGMEIGLRKTNTDYLDDVSTTYADKAALQAFSGAKAVEMAFRGGELKSPLTYPAAGAQRGSAKHKDWYYFTGINLSYRFHATVGGSGKSSKLGCPMSIQ